MNESIDQPCNTSITLLKLYALTWNGILRINTLRWKTGHRKVQHGRTRTTYNCLALLDTTFGGFLGVVRAARVLDTFRDLVDVIIVHAEASDVVWFAIGGIRLGDAFLRAGCYVQRLE